jgi:hypothetical protein
MMKKIILLICLSLVFSQQLQVDGNLKVTGEIDANKIDSLKLVIQQLEKKLAISDYSLSKVGVLQALNKMNYVKTNINKAGQELINSSLFYYSGWALKIIGLTLIVPTDEKAFHVLGYVSLITSIICDFIAYDRIADGGRYLKKVSNELEGID